MAAPLIPNLSMKMNIRSRMIFNTSPITAVKLNKLQREKSVDFIFLVKVIDSQ